MSEPTRRGRMAPEMTILTRVTLDSDNVTG
jgi:hypothetical protein